MSIHTVEIDDKVIFDTISQIINKSINQELLNRYSSTGHEIRDIVKDIVYSRKDEIIEMTVDRATREIVKKGLPKLIDRLQGEDK